jgi:hypothetical protein
MGRILSRRICECLLCFHIIPGPPGTPQVKIQQANHLARVIFFNLGTHHVPTSGDIPNTLMHTSASSVIFTPHNFHDRDPSRQSAQGVRLELDERGHKVRYFGGRYEKGVKLDVVSAQFYYPLLNIRLDIGGLGLGNGYLTNSLVD